MDQLHVVTNAVRIHIRMLWDGKNAVAIKERRLSHADTVVGVDIPQDHVLQLKLMSRLGLSNGSGKCPNAFCNYSLHFDLAVGSHRTIWRRVSTWGFVNFFWKISIGQKGTSVEVAIDGVVLDSMG
jgi:hypothetical protein